MPMMCVSISMSADIHYGLSLLPTHEHSTADKLEYPLPHKF